MVSSIARESSVRGPVPSEPLAFSTLARSGGGPALCRLKMRKTSRLCRAWSNKVRLKAADCTDTTPVPQTAQRECCVVLQANCTVRVLCCILSKQCSGSAVLHCKQTVQRVCSLVLQANSTMGVLSQHDRSSKLETPESGVAPGSGALTQERCCSLRVRWASLPPCGGREGREGEEPLVEA